MIDKIEVGKTYVFVSEDAKNEFLMPVGGISYNSVVYNLYYKDGFKIDEDESGFGKIEDHYAIAPEEYEFFKLKEDKVVTKNQQKKVKENVTKTVKTKIHPKTSNALVFKYKNSSYVAKGVGNVEINVVDGKLIVVYTATKQQGKFKTVNETVSVILTNDIEHVVWIKADRTKEIVLDMNS